MARTTADKWLTVENLNLIKSWARDALIDVEIAKKMEINPDTLYTWKKKYPELAEALRVGKEASDAQQEASLYQAGLGYKYIEKQAIKVKKQRFENGKVLTDEEIEIVDVERFKTPEITASIFWLKNRQRDKWRDRVDIEHSGTVKLEDMLDG